MKNQLKTLLVVFVFTALIAIMVVFWYPSRKGFTYDTKTRPEDFPKILIAPKGAYCLDHSTPTNSHRAPFSGILYFSVDDPCPSEKTRNFIREHLISHNWQRLEYHLLNPDVPSKYPNAIWYSILKESNSLEAYEKDPVNYHGIGTEDWINDNDEHIGITWSYKPLIDKKKVDPNTARFSITLFKRDSWIRPELLRYKKIHPEEFEHFRDGSEPNDMQEE